MLESSTHKTFLGNNSDALMYWMSVSPLLALPTLNLQNKFTCQFILGEYLVTCDNLYLNR